MTRLRPHLLCAIGLCALATALVFQAGPASAQLGKKKHLFMKGLMGAGLLKLLKPKKGVLPIPLPLPVPLPVDWQQQAGLLAHAKQHSHHQQSAGSHQISSYSYPQQAMQLAPIDFNEYQSAMQQAYGAGNSNNYLSSGSWPTIGSYGQTEQDQSNVNSAPDNSAYSNVQQANGYSNGNSNYNAYSLIPNTAAANAYGNDNSAQSNSGQNNNDNQDAYGRDASYSSVSNDAGYGSSSASSYGDQSQGNNQQSGYEESGNNGYQPQSSNQYSYSQSLQHTVQQQPQAIQQQYQTAPQQQYQVSQQQQQQQQQYPSLSQYSNNNNNQVNNQGNLYAAASSQSFAFANRQPIAFYAPQQPLTQSQSQSNGHSSEYSAPLNSGWIAIN